MFASSCELKETLLTQARGAAWPPARCPSCLVAGAIMGGGTSRGQSGLPGRPHPDSVTLGLSVLIWAMGPKDCQAHQTL